MPGYYYGFDPTMILLIPAILLSLYAQIKVKSTFKRYLSVANRNRLTEREAARRILDNNGLESVEIEMVAGRLSDHYDPRTRVMRLSEEVYNGDSISSVSVASHEAGHAIQHGNGYMPLKFRNILAPVVSFASQLAIPLIFIGIFFDMLQLFDIGILFFAGAVLFQVVTLPVEFNASNRAVEQMETLGVIVADEKSSAKKVLNAAALTYVAAMAVSVMQLLRLIILRNQRN